MTEPLNWHKSTYSSGGTNDCIEVADNQPAIYVRDTKDHAQGTIRTSRDAWSTFTAYAVTSSC
ncbi:DUF397 domain-containing protein [Streptomyces sp. NPDC001571]